MNQDPTRLLAAIVEKEEAEKRKKKRLLILAAGIFLAVLGSGFAWMQFGPQEVILPPSKLDIASQQGPTEQEENRLVVTAARPLAPINDSATTGELISGPVKRADVMPSFPGGASALYRFLSHQIHYPEAATQKRVEGKVFVRFVVQADGSITDVEVIQGIGYGCDEEAKRVVEQMPKWIPGEINAQEVAVYSSLAVNFKFL
ncbi:MAG: TonB family protein [Bacteroidota bacterium]